MPGRLLRFDLDAVTTSQRAPSYMEESYVKGIIEEKQARPSLPLLTQGTSIELHARILSGRPTCGRLHSASQLHAPSFRSALLRSCMCQRHLSIAPEASIQRACTQPLSVWVTCGAAGEVVGLCAHHGGRPALLRARGGRRAGEGPSFASCQQHCLHAQPMVST